MIRMPSDIHDDPVDCVALMLLDNDRILAECRKATKQLLPGVLAIPGGHVEAGETPEQALVREAAEELGIALQDPRFVCSLLHRAQEFRRLSYFAVTGWSGEIMVREAEALRWVPLAALGPLDLAVDRLAVREYLRVYRC